MYEQKCQQSKLTASSFEIKYASNSQLVCIEEEITYTSEIYRLALQPFVFALFFDYKPWEMLELVILRFNSFICSSSSYNNHTLKIMMMIDNQLHNYWVCTITYTKTVPVQSHNSLNDLLVDVIAKPHHSETWCIKISATQYKK